MRMVGQKESPEPATETVELENATSYHLSTVRKTNLENAGKKGSELNQETGRGETRNTKLYVKDVPVLAVPYFNFPIDDRRTTGILTPTFGFTNDGCVWNWVLRFTWSILAPEADATITPRYTGDRGTMLDVSFAI